MQEIRFRTVTGEEYEIPSNPAQTIGDLIVTLQESMNDPRYTNINLIYQGDILDPSETVSNIGKIPDDEFILVKNSKRRAKVKKEEPPSNEGPQSQPPIEKVETIQEQGPKSQPVHRRQKRGLPLRTEIQLPDKDPPEFQKDVDILMELGDFKREDVEKALRMSFFNPDRATAYLFSGKIPDYPEPEVNSRPRKQNNSSNKEKVEDPNSKFEKLTKEQKDLIMLVIEDTGKDFPTVLQTAVACDFNEYNLRSCLLKD